MNSSSRFGWRDDATVALLVLAWLAATAWLRPLALPDEGRYVGVAWEMLRSGDWLVPTLNGLPYFHKPPLFYWITASALAGFGLNEWAARAAPLLGATLGALALYRFTLRWGGPRQGRLALLALATQPLFFVAAQYANLDMLVAGCITATILAAAHATLSARQGGPWRAALAAAYGFAALGVLAKGLIGAVLPGLVVLAWLGLQRDGRGLLRLLWLPGLALFLLVAGPWFLAMQARFPDFGHYFFVVQHFQRFALTGFNNAQPGWFYLAVLGLFTLPWFLWLLAAVRRGPAGDAPQGAARQLMWVWLLVVTAFFSWPQAKLVGYILPVLAPLAYLAADVAARHWERSPRVPLGWRVSTAVAALACLVIPALITGVPQKSHRDLGQELADGIGPDSTVLFLHEYYFDMPFYAGLREPVRVVQEWDDPRMAERDNWRKELLDAARFAGPREAAALVRPDEVAGIVCAAGDVWVLGSHKAVRRYPVLAGARELGQSGEVVLWHLPAPPGGRLTSPGCPGKPSANSTGR